MLPKLLSTGGEYWVAHRLQISCLAVSLFVVWVILRHFRLVFRSDLAKIPGPTWARFTALWRPWILIDGTAPEVYKALHKKYGPLVRTAPNVVSVSDPNSISTIYGIGSKFYKVITHHNCSA